MRGFPTGRAMRLFLLVLCVVMLWPHPAVLQSDPYYYTPTPSPASTSTPTSTPASEYTPTPSGQADPYSYPSTSPGSTGALSGAEATTIPYDGVGNNVRWPKWASAGSAQKRQVPVAYTDGASTPRVGSLKGARDLSNILFSGSPAFEPRANAMTVSWAQLVVHDTIMSKGGTEQWDIPVPRCDGEFDSACTGSKKLFFKRSAWVEGTGSSQGNPRIPINLVTAYLDASPIYGSSETVANALRTFQGGRLKAKTDDSILGEVMPLLTEPQASQYSINPTQARALFQAGDFRTNASPAILTLHTIFLREHNRLAGEISAKWPNWSDEAVFQRARRRVMGQWQKITFEEYLPIVLGGQRLPPYTGYKESTNAAVSVMYQAAAMRYGHSAMNQLMSRLSRTGQQLAGGPMQLSGNMFQPPSFLQTGAEAFLVGMVTDDEGDVDVDLPFDMRNRIPFMGPANADSSYVRWTDIAATNIQRGRDMGLPSLNELRVHYGLTAYTSWTEISSNPSVVERLKQAYATVDDVEAWPGGLAEDPYNGAQVGSTFYHALVDQFTRMRDGDRMFYLNQDNPDRAIAEPGDKLGAIIKRTTQLSTFPDSAFAVAPRSTFRAALAPSAGNYENTVQLFPDYQISWTLDSDFVHIELQAGRTGWVGLGFGTSMVDVDLVIGWADPSAGTSSVNDYWTSSFQPFLDSSVGGGNDLVNTEAKEENGVTTVRFSKPLKKSDNWDSDIARSGPQPITFALGGSDALGYHGASNRGMGTIDFSTGEATVTTVNYAKWLHGMGMLFGWGFALPIGVLCARYLKTRRRWWLPAHKILQGFGAASTVPFALGAIVGSRGQAYSAHAYLGFIILGLTIVQAVLGNTLGWFLTHPKYVDNFGWARHAHRTVGWILVCITQAQIPIGMARLNISNVLRYAYHGYQALFVAFIAFMEYRDRFPQDVSKVKYSSIPPLASKYLEEEGTPMEEVKGSDTVPPAPTLSDEGLPIWTTSMFDHWTFRGRNVIVIDNYVLDVEEWLPLHPAGPMIIKQAIGKDATGVFYGEQGFHRHSKRALVAMARYRIAVLRDEHEDTVHSDDLTASTDALGGKHVVPFSTRPTRMGRRGTIQAAEVTDRNVYGTFTLKRTTALTTRDPRPVFSFVFKPARAPVSLRQGLPGQHMSLRVHTGAGGSGVCTRYYTPVNMYADANEIEFVIRVVEGGRLTSYLHDNLMIGDTVEICTDVRGEGISMPPNCDAVCFIAAGSGLTPFLAYVRWAVARGLEHPIYVVIVNQQEPVGLQLLEEARRDLPELHILSLLTRPPSSHKGKTGRLNVDQLSRFVHSSLDKTRLYICGPPEFEMASMSMAMEAGFRKDLSSLVYSQYLDDDVDAVGTEAS